MHRGTFNNFEDFSIEKLSTDNPSVERLKRTINVLIDELIKYGLLPSDKRLAEIKDIVYLELLMDSLSDLRNQAQLRKATRKVHRLDIELDLLMNLHARFEEALQNMEKHYGKTS